LYARREKRIERHLSCTWGAAVTSHDERIGDSPGSGVRPWDLLMLLRHLPTLLLWLLPSRLFLLMGSPLRLVVPIAPVVLTLAFAGPITLPATKPLVLPYVATD
jgi:hypothetical protein